MELASIVKMRLSLKTQEKHKNLQSKWILIWVQDKFYFMDKCYNRELAQADLDYVFNRDDEKIHFIKNCSKKHKDFINGISYEERLKSKVTLNLHSNTSKDLVINLNNKYDKKKFKGMIYYIQF